MVNQKLNNEVVRMRPVVRRAKVIVIRYLIKRAKHLRSMKGNDEQKAKNERRAERLISEMEAMKDLRPDIVTKKALKDDITMEDLNKPTATMEERAVARIICHRDIVKKNIDKIKENYSLFDIEILCKERRPKKKTKQKDADKKKNKEEQKPGSDGEEKDDSTSDTGDEDVEEKDEDTIVVSELPAGAKADSNFTKSTKSKEKSLFHDSDNEPDLNEETQKRTTSKSSHNAVDFRGVGQKALQSTFCGSLSSASTEKRRKNNKPDKRKDKPRPTQKQMTSNPNVMRRERQQAANPCKVDSAVKRQPQTVKRKEENKKANTSSSEKMHPSWEASRRKREQEAVLVKFQGKKIKFDDDDD